MPIHDFYLLPGSTPNRETVLEPGDLITSVTLPAPRAGTRSVYLKLRDRAAYEFALASAAVVATVDGGTIRRVRVALGGVGTKPWRSLEAEAGAARHAGQMPLPSAPPPRLRCGTHTPPRERLQSGTVQTLPGPRPDHARQPRKIR